MQKNSRGVREETACQFQVSCSRLRELFLNKEFLGLHLFVTIVRLLRHNVPRNDRWGYKTLYKKYFRSGFLKVCLQTKGIPPPQTKLLFA
ncbi:hypothetical protein [Helicobacter burdigaliensis]|uniref:hypothetical protein n=1 Tax=Helicobacter burdigaliensis TaxID=2315334 RepID=UPI0013002787|nr:hypothetical protein [Helicobacter burdigaliensis]